MHASRSPPVRPRTAAYTAWRRCRGRSGGSVAVDAERAMSTYRRRPSCLQPAAGPEPAATGLAFLSRRCHPPCQPALSPSATHSASGHPSAPPSASRVHVARTHRGPSPRAGQSVGVHAGRHSRASVTLPTPRHTAKARHLPTRVALCVMSRSRPLYDRVGLL
jgi:hypothetical protein